MKKIITVMCGLALAATALVIPVLPAQAQLSGSYTCVANSSFAEGVGINYNLDFACRRAVRECQIRTPVGFLCVANRWWYNY